MRSTVETRFSKHDDDWENFAAREPYFAVLTAPQYLWANLSPLARREFFATGEALVDWLLDVIDASLQPKFAPASILEYGCGVGRLAFPLSRLPATVTAVDRSEAMLREANAEATRRGQSHVRFMSADDFWRTEKCYELVVCNHVFQLLAPRTGHQLLRLLLERVSPDGVGVFQFPVGTRTSRMVRGTRWLRSHLKLANDVANLLRGKPSGQAFVPTHVYDLTALLHEFDLSEFTTHVHLERDVDLDVAIVLARRGNAKLASTVRGDSPAASRLSVPPVTESQIAAFNEAAERYFATLKDWDHHLAKPFSDPEETATILASLATTMHALALQPGMTVLDFGAGSGWLSRYLSQMGARVIVMDVSPTALDIAQELYRRVPPIGNTPAPIFVQFDGKTIDLAGNAVDRIVCFDAFHHAANPDDVIREFARILRPGGLAVFSEPGPRHSESARSQFEVNTYGVVERDVDVHALWRTAQAAGFSDLRLCVFNARSHQVSLGQFEDLLASDGTSTADWVKSTREFMGYVRNFVLTRGSAETADSRTVTGLACDIRVAIVQMPGAELQPLIVEGRVTNTGDATWLPFSAGRGGVALGAHLHNANGDLLVFDFHWAQLTDPAREILPGETVTLRTELPRLDPGTYTIEFDCVALDVTWFARRGSKPATVSVTIPVSA